jgi:hypothetical protein
MAAPDTQQLVSSSRWPAGAMGTVRISAREGEPYNENRVEIRDGFNVANIESAADPLKNNDERKVEEPLKIRFVVNPAVTPKPNETLNEWLPFNDTVPPTSISSINQNSQMNHSL